MLWPSLHWISRCEKSCIISHNICVVHTKSNTLLCWWKLTIIDCIFLNKRINYAIVAPLLDIKVEHCVFHSSNGAINCKTTRLLLMISFMLASKSPIFQKTSGKLISIVHLFSDTCNSRVDNCPFIDNVGTFWIFHHTSEENELFSTRFRRCTLLPVYNGWSPIP